MWGAFHGSFSNPKRSKLRRAANLAIRSYFCAAARRARMHSGRLPLGQHERPHLNTKCMLTKDGDRQPPPRNRPLSTCSLALGADTLECGSLNMRLQQSSAVLQHFKVRGRHVDNKGQQICASCGARQIFWVYTRGTCFAKFWLVLYMIT